MADRLFASFGSMAGQAPKPAKIDPAVVLYMSPQLIDKAGAKAVAKEPGAACGKCMMFLQDTEECSILKPAAVSPHGVCGLFVGGAPTSKDHQPMKLVPKDVAGYTDDGPTRCGTCEYFESPSSCQKVSGQVHEDGCCNGYEPLGGESVEREAEEEAPDSTLSRILG